MSPSSADPSAAVTVLIADSSRMQAQLLTSALRRRSEFRIFTCLVDTTSLLQAVASTPAKVVVLSLDHSANIANQMATIRRVHLSHPDVAKVLKAKDNQYLEELEEILGRPVLVKGDPALHNEKFDLG